MKRTDRLPFKFTLVLAIFVILGCGSASELLSTSTPAITSTPSNTPPPTATFTSTPAPDISAARISLNELPAGFEEIPADEFGLDKTTSSNDTFKPEVVFAFVNTTQFQMIIGMNFFVSGGLERVGFDLAVNQPEKALKEMASALGTQNVRDEKILEGLDDVGDARIGMTMIADMEGMEGTPMQVDIMLFRRDTIGGMLISMTFAEKPGSISLHDLGKLFDQNIQKTLETLK